MDIVAEPGTLRYAATDDDVRKPLTGFNRKEDMAVQAVIQKVLPWIILLLAAWLFLRWFEWKNLYYPAREIRITPEDLRLAYEEIEFLTEDGHTLHGWWFPCKHARGTILVCHGNAGNIGDRVWMAGDLLRLGVNVFLFDYRGYGRSRGIATEKGLYRDARAAYEVVRARYNDMDDPPVIVYGRSLGAAVAVQLAADKPVRGLIAESTFTSVVDMAGHLYPVLPVGLLCHDRYDSIRKVDRLKMPKIFAHSRGDTLIPYAMGRALYEKAAPPKRFYELTGDHNDSGWMQSSGYWRGLEQFVHEVFGAQQKNKAAAME
jgi:hypothetical protein